MNILKYELLLAALKKGNITAAAEEMNYSQSGATHMLNSLEEELGIQLVTRGRNGIRLTPEGERLLEPIRKTVEAHREVMRQVDEIKGTGPNTLSIASFVSPVAVYLSEPLSALKQAHPEMTIRYRTSTPEEIDQWVNEGLVDLGCYPLPLISPKESLPFQTDRVVVTCGSDYPHQFRDPLHVTEEDLARERIISSSYANEKFDLLRYFPHIPVSQFDFRVSEETLQLDLARDNFGIAVTTQKILERYGHGLQVFELAEPLEITIALVYKNEESLSPAAKELLRIVQDRSR